MVRAMVDPLVVIIINAVMVNCHVRRFLTQVDSKYSLFFLVGNL